MFHGPLDKDSCLQKVIVKSVCRGILKVRYLANVWQEECPGCSGCHCNCDRQNRIFTILDTDFLTLGTSKVGPLYVYIVFGIVKIAIFKGRVLWSSLYAVLNI